MKTKMQKKSPRGTKHGRTVRLGNELLACEKINDRYPICDFAQKVIDALKPGCDESSLYYLTNCFRGFSEEMQIAMASFIIGEYAYRIDGEDIPEMTGVFHVDRLLMEIIFILDHDTKNLRFNK